MTNLSRLARNNPYGLSIIAGILWFAGGVCTGINGHLILYLLSPVLTLIGGTLAAVLAAMTKPT